MKIERQWEDYPEGSGTWDLTSHPAELQEVLSEEEIERRCESRYASVKLVDGKFHWEVGYISFYPVVTDEGICETLKEAQTKAEEVFVDKYVVNFEKTMEVVR